MSRVLVFPLDAIRTDGWFERIGQGIGSFRALCDILGERFFAFSMITGARITALTVDRRNPDDTMVEFTVSGDPDDPEPEVQRLNLPAFRRRLVAALVTEGPIAPSPVRDTDQEALQLHIGVRYLLLAPLFGYSLQKLETDGATSVVSVRLDGRDAVFDLAVLQHRLRAHVRDELERVSKAQRSTIDLAHVSEAEEASARADWKTITQLLGSWPAPLAIFLRTPEGHALPTETRSLIAKGLGLLATSWAMLGDLDRAEEIFRLGVQYGQEGPAAADIFLRFGRTLMESRRTGEAIGLLRRGLSLGAPAPDVLPLLAKAYADRKRFVAAFACLQKAAEAGVPADRLAGDRAQVEEKLGNALHSLRSFLAESSTRADRRALVDAQEP